MKPAFKTITIFFALQYFHDHKHILITNNKKNQIILLNVIHYHSKV